MKSSWIFIGVLVLGVAGGGVLARQFNITRTAPPSAVPAPIAPPAALADLQDSFHRVVERIKPSVVHITVSAGGTRGLGSGLIVSAEGHVVTNYHVVAEVLGSRRRNIEVRLFDGKTVKGDVLGYNWGADIAVLKIPSSADLVPAALGDSDVVRVGDIVLAVGSPFGLDQTVTMGIVSAKGRELQKLGLDIYGEFIQTDAAVNRGNSGGPLVNLKGEVIGINTLIVSPSAQNIGLAFARPINVVKVVNDKILAGKRLGFVGVECTDFEDPTIVRKLMELGMLVYGIEDIQRELGLKEPKGVVVTGILDNFPAAQAGIKVFDVIYEYNGQPVKKFSELKNLITETLPGAEVVVKMIRAGRSLAVKIKVGEQP